MDIKSKFKRIYVICTTDHGNLGDHKISECEIAYLADMFEGAEITEVPLGQYENMKGRLIREVKPEDLIVFHGGGSVGTLWPKSEAMRQEMAELFPYNPKVMFPQSVFYEDSEEGREALLRSKKAYNNPTLVFACRDTESYDFVNKEFACRTVLTPDIVLSCDPQEIKNCKSGENKNCKDGEKKYIVLCLRKDKEGALSENDREKITEAAARLGCEIIEKDTVCPYNIDPKDRKKELKDYFDCIKQAELVITDRLHGMIFCAICGVSCITCANSYFKIAGQYRWIEACDNIHFAKSVDELERFVNEKIWEKEEAVLPDLKEKFEPLKDALIDIASYDNEERNKVYTINAIKRLADTFDNENQKEEWTKRWADKAVDMLAKGFMSINNHQSALEIVSIAGETGMLREILRHDVCFYNNADNFMIVKRMTEAVDNPASSKEFSAFFEKYHSYFESKDDMEALDGVREEYSKLDSTDRHILKLALSEDKIGFARRLIFDWVEYSEASLEYKNKYENAAASLDFANRQNQLMKKAISHGSGPSRVDIRLEGKEPDGEKSFVIEEVSDALAGVDMPQWMQAKGEGYSVTAYSGKMRIKAFVKGGRKIRFELRGIDKKNEVKERVPCWLDYTKFQINGKEYLQNHVSTWHDRPHVICIEVKDGMPMEIYYEWEPVNEIIKRQ